MDRYIGSINKMSARIKQRILAENGIRLRHYAIDMEGNSPCIRWLPWGERRWGAAFPG